MTGIDRNMKSDGSIVMYSIGVKRSDGDFDLRVAIEMFSINGIVMNVTGIDLGSWIKQ